MLRDLTCSLNARSDPGAIVTNYLALAVVTGAAGGIGEAITLDLQRDGWRVIGVDRVDASAADQHLQLDLADVTAVEAIAEHVGGRPLSGLVNNAAISTSAPTEEIGATGWDQILAVNLRAPFLLSERLVENLGAAQGAVVNMASVHAFATSPGTIPYASSKGGLVALTRAQAIDWGARGLPIRSNAVAPGAVDTPMLRDAAERMGSDLSDLTARHPSGRVGLPKDVAALVTWLLSPASSFINGAVLPIDGGALAQLSTEPTPFGVPS